MNSEGLTSDSKIRRRRIAVGAIAAVAAVASTVGVIRACSDESVSHTLCLHMESVMGDVAGAQFAGLRQGDVPLMLLHIAPRMADTLQLLVDDAPAETSPLFEILHRNFDLGTLLLKRTMGYPDDKIAELSTVEISENTTIEDLVVEGTNANSIESAADNLTELLGSTYFERKAGETPRFRADGVKCGVFPEPDEGDCTDILVNETIANTYGFPIDEFASTVTVTYDDGNCQWTINYEPSELNPEGDNAFLWVDVFSNTVANRVLTARLAEPSDVTTRPVIVDGARHSIGVLPCGRTAYVDFEGRSAVIAACGPRDLDDTTLVNLAIEAIESR